MQSYRIEIPLDHSAEVPPETDLAGAIEHARKALVAAHHRRARQGGAGRHRMTANVCELRYDEHMTKERGAAHFRNHIVAILTSHAPDDVVRVLYTRHAKRQGKRS